MKKIITLLCFPFCSYAQSVTTYTLTPYQNASSVNVSCALTQSNGQTVDYPVNYAYPLFSRDSIKVQFWNASSGNSLMSVPDSINHFYLGTRQLPTKGVKSIDSFFHCCMTK